MKWPIAAVALLLVVSACAFWPSNAENTEEEDGLTVNDEGDEQVVRQERAAKGMGGKRRGGNQGGGNNRGDCKYTKGPWSECNPNTREKVRVLQLKRNGGSCEPTKQEAKPCKNSKLCRYSRGNWSECNPDTLSMERMDTLKPGMEQSCEATRKKVKKCKACQYDRQATWTECDPQTEKRSRVQKLVVGDPNRCEPSKTQSRTCKRPDGKERCFYGPWTEWGRCDRKANQKKTRPVLSGGKKCQRKAVKTRNCNSHQS